MKHFTSVQTGATSMVRQTGLFSEIQLTEDLLREKCEPHYLSLWKMIKTPFEDLKSRIDSNDRAFKVMKPGHLAQFLRPQIVDHATTIFSGTDVKVEEKRQQIFIRFPDFVVIPKKFKNKKRGEGMTFSSYDTLQNMKFWRQQELDGIPSLPRVMVGYQFILNVTDIRIWIAYPYGKRLNTLFLIPDQTKGIIEKMAIMPEVESPDDLGVYVKPRTVVREPLKQNDKVQP